MRLSRAAWLACAVAIVVMTVVGLVPEAAGQVARRGIVELAFGTLWLASITGWGMLTPLPRVQASIWLRIATRAAAGCGFAGFILLALGCAGALNTSTAWAVQIIGLLFLVPAVLGFARHVPVRHWLSGRAGEAWLLLAAMPVLGVWFVASCVYPGLLWADEPLGYDVASYHLQVPRQWHDLRAIAPLPENIYSYLPLGLELHFLSAMHQRGGAYAAMYASHVMHGVLVLLCALGAYGAVRPIGRAQALSAGAIVLLTPWSVLLGSIAYNDGAMMLYILLAVAWSLEALRGIQVKASAGLAGLMAGLATGIKPSAGVLFLIPLAIVVPMLLHDARRRVQFALFFGLFATLSVAPWLIRNTIWTGNPVFPETFGVFPQGSWTDMQVQRWRAAHSPRADQQTILARGAEFWRQVPGDWRYGYLLIPGALIALGARRTPQSALLLLILLAMSASWGMLTHLQGRFLVGLIPLCALAIGGSSARIAMLLALAVLIGSVPGQYRVVQQLLPVARTLGDAQLLGSTDMRTLFASALQPPPIAERIEAWEREQAGPLLLVGEARAFFFPMESGRLRYRTVFDVPSKPDDDPIEAWRRGLVSGTEASLALIQPAEVARLARTYRGMPAPPVDWPSEPFLRILPPSP